jgi:cytochrome bd-type quinol oxidase subunit 2
MLNLLGLIPTAFAQTTIDLRAEDAEAGFDTLSNLSIGGVIQTFITIALIVAGIVFLFMLILGGIRWIMSGGDKAQTETARNQITAALIGLVVVFAAYAIATLVANIFGVDILDFEVPTIPGAGTDLTADPNGDLPGR